MDRNVIETGEDGVTKWNPMLTWVNDSFSQISGVKGDDETVDSLQHRKVGRTGINPTLTAAGHLLCILSAVGRTGINPALAAAGHLL